MPKGKFFVLEGVDGSGKATQTKLLTQALLEKGYKVEKVDFPQYGKVSAGLVENYLKGIYGSSENVGPYRASIFYACDRYDLSFRIGQWLEEGKIVIADRYVASNIGHQGGKLIAVKKKWEEYINWLYNLEYCIFNIPKPDCNFILKISPDLSMTMSNKITDKEKIRKRMLYLGDSKKQDIHESDKKHLENTLKSYLAISKKFPKEYKVIECERNGQFLPIQTIHKEILSVIEKKLK